MKKYSYILLLIICSFNITIAQKNKSSIIKVFVDTVMLKEVVVKTTTPSNFKWRSKEDRENMSMGNSWNLSVRWIKDFLTSIGMWSYHSMIYSIPQKY